MIDITYYPGCSLATTAKENFEILDSLNLAEFSQQHAQRLAGLRFVTYYGCMLARPPRLKP